MDDTDTNGGEEIEEQPNIKIDVLQDVANARIRDGVIELRRILEEWESLQSHSLKIPYQQYLELLEEYNTKKETYTMNKEKLLNSVDGDIVLNVGGVCYNTQLSTILQEESVISLFFSDGFELAMVDGAYFIDRDGSHFDVILDYLSSKLTQEDLQKYTRQTLQSLLIESEFYGTGDLSSMIRIELGIATANDLSEYDNLLVDQRCGGSSLIVEYNFYNGATAYNQGTINGNPDSNWQNNGMIISSDHPDRLISHRINTNIGSTWGNGLPNESIGVVVIDITGQEQAVAISRFCAFQMNSDGRATHIRISAALPIDNPLPYNSTDWLVMLNWQTIGQFEEVPNPPEFGSGNSITCTEVWRLPTFHTRYLKVELRNDGSHGSNGYIELRQLMAFSL
eukprot:TRINITY_DN1930_c0_g1_i3.p1 TRINITY_DN1930_c0_g1~~TRINITY_DN1930_c0_g1_i3.p1  ORF type:complete len:395 (+),score=78.54 TRINITY_DN1930_c0_g1_i3:105-1289(+)